MSGEKRTKFTKDSLLPEGTVLFTKDGRTVGNAVVVMRFKRGAHITRSVFPVFKDSDSACETHEPLKSMPISGEGIDALYEIITDFGNRMTLSMGEILGLFHDVCVVKPDLALRFNRQRVLLQRAPGTDFLCPVCKVRARCQCEEDTFVDPLTLKDPWEATK